MMSKSQKAVRWDGFFLLLLLFAAALTGCLNRINRNGTPII